LNFWLKHLKKIVEGNEVIRRYYDKHTTIKDKILKETYIRAYYLTTLNYTTTNPGTKTI